MATVRRSRRGTQRAATAARKGRRTRALSVSLGTALTIAEVRDCWRTLQSSLDSGHTTIDARALVSIDTAGVQLLLASGRASAARGLRLTVGGAPTLLLEAAASLGLDAALTEVLELSP